MDVANIVVKEANMQKFLIHNGSKMEIYAAGKNEMFPLLTTINNTRTKSIFLLIIRFYCALRTFKIR